MNHFICFNSNVFQIMPKHVKEAYRLLNKSIIRVDQPDIHLDDDEADEEMEIDDPAAEGEAPDQQVQHLSP